MFTERVFRLDENPRTMFAKQMFAQLRTGLKCVLLLPISSEKHGCRRHFICVGCDSPRLREKYFRDTLAMPVQSRQA